jgi:hypothetical protein
MKRLIFALAISLMLLSLTLFPVSRRATGQTEGQTKFYNTENPVPDHYNVILRSDIRNADLEAVANEFASTYQGSVIRFFYETSLNGFELLVKEDAAKSISLDSRVEFVSEVDAVKPAIDDSSSPPPAEESLETEENQDPTDDTLIALKPTTEMKPKEQPDPNTTIEASFPTAEEDQKLVADLPPNPQKNLRLSSDPRYFTYGNDNQTIALLGDSSSYVPHILRNRAKNGVYDPVKENCTLDQLTYPDGRMPKYQKCMQMLRTAGLNHMQIWVVLNHSLGKLCNDGPDPAHCVQGAPYVDEQPFTFANNKWMLNTGVQLTGPHALEGFNQNFFDNLKAVISTAQGQGIIVGVVLFDPWSAWNDAGTQPVRSPWYATPANPATSNNIENKTFTDPTLFVRAETPGLNPTGTPGTAIDTDPTNVLLRNVQVALMEKTVKELKDFKNIYWVLANEPDIDGRAIGRSVIVWHRYMAKTLRAYEDSLIGGDLTKRHLIAVNVTTNPATPPGGVRTDVISALREEGVIDIINSHYVNLTGPAGPVPAADRYGAMRLLRTWNIYDGNGIPAGTNNKRWGFSEDRPSGVSCCDLPYTADNVRVEAWEFFMNGGALFDHLSYRWGNPANGDNSTQADNARNYLGYLGRFLNTIRLDGMKRMMPGLANSWLEAPPTYGQPFWAAMSRPRTVDAGVTNFQSFLFYAHRSVDKGARYDAYHVDPPNLPVLKNITIKVKNLGNNGCYRADWYYPSGEIINGKGGQTNRVLNPAQTDMINFFPTTANPTRSVTSPPYRQDVVVKITWVKSTQCT